MTGRRDGAGGKPPSEESLSSGVAAVGATTGGVTDWTEAWCEEKVVALRTT